MQYGSGMNPDTDDGYILYTSNNLFPKDWNLTNVAGTEFKDISVDKLCSQA